LSHKSNYISILQFDERLMSRLRVHRSAKGVEVISHDVEQGDWNVRDGSLEAALKAFAAKYKLADDTVYTILPRHEITARIIELPSQDPDELVGMIRLSCEEYVPYPAEELIIDQCILQKVAGGQARVLAVFAHRDVVDGHMRLLQNAGIEPKQIYLSTACLASAAMAGAAPAAGRFALMNLASGGLEILVMAGRRLEYGRAVASPQDWSLAADTANPASAEIQEELQVELRASLSAHRRESDDGEGVDIIYLSSDWTPVKDHCCLLANDFAEECREAPFVRELAVRGADTLRGIPLAALGAALLAQERGEVSIRLLPESVMAARRRSGSKQKAVRYAVAAGFVLAGIALYYGQAVYQRQSYIKKLRAQIAQVEKRAQGIASKQKQLQIIKEQVEQDDNVLHLLSELCQVYPESGMNITRFVYSHKERLEVYGRAKVLDEVFKLTNDLRALGKASLKQFAQAQQAYYVKSNERGQEVWDYRFFIPLNATEEVRIEEDDIE